MTEEPENNVESLVMIDEFKAELDARVNDIKEGKTKGIPHDELMTDLRSVIDEAKP